MKILVAVDGSEFTRRVLDYVVANSSWLGIGHEFHLMTVVPAVPPHAAAPFAREQLEEYYGDEAEKVLGPIRTRLADSGLPLSYLHRIGQAGAEVAREAAKGGYGLVIMGSHGHSSLAKLVLGSVTTNVLAACAVPVLVVR